MPACKKTLVRLCLSLAMIGVFALMATVASQAVVSAASPRGSMLSPRNTPGVRPNTGVVPNAACGAAITSSCTAGTSGISTSLSGALAVNISDGTVTPPGTLDGSGTQTVSFSFPSGVIDTTGTDGWVLTATSPGLTVQVPGTTAIDPFTITGVTAGCAVTSSCSGAGHMTAGTGLIPSTTPGLDYATVTALSGGDYGSTTVTTNGTASLGATTIGGSASGTITVTAAPSLT